MGKKKILIVYASAGSGHRKAADAVLEGFNSLNLQNLDIKLVDSIDYTTRIFKFLYPRIYILLINRLTLLWGFFYYILENRFIWFFASKIRHISNYLNTKKFRDLISDFKPDIVVSTHFLAIEVVSSLKKNGLTDSKLICVLTDYLPHSVWISKEVDFYLVGSTDSLTALVKRGISSSKIKITGIPVSLNFCKNYDRQAVCEKLGLKNKLFTVLITSGGYGVGPLKKLVKNLSSIPVNFQAILICGKNQKLKRDFESIKENFKFSLKIFGFVDNMYELMAASDIIITKAGGITVSEALAVGLPMLIVFPVPGQETRNAFVLEKYGTARIIRYLSDLSEIVSSIFVEKEKFEQMKHNVKAFAPVCSAAKTAEFVTNLL